MSKFTVTTPAPPLTRDRNWPIPQMTLPQKAPNQPSVNGTPQVMRLPKGGGANP